MWRLANRSDLRVHQPADPGETWRPGYRSRHDLFASRHMGQRDARLPEGLSLVVLIELKHGLHGFTERPGDPEGELQGGHVSPAFKGDDCLTGAASSVRKVLLCHLAADKPQVPYAVGNAGFIHDRLTQRRSTTGWRPTRRSNRTEKWCRLGTRANLPEQSVVLRIVCRRESTSRRRMP